MTSVAATVLLLLLSSSIVLLPLSEERWPLQCGEVQKHCVTSVHLHLCRREGGERSGIISSLLWWDFFFFFFLMPRDMIYYITWIGEKQNNLYSERTVKTTFLKICISLSMQHAGIAKLLSSHRTPVCLYVNHKIRHWMMLCCLEHQQMHPSIWVDVSEDNSTVHFLCRSVYGRYNKMRGPTLYRSH